MRILNVKILWVDYDDGTCQSHNFGQAGQNPTSWERLPSDEQVQPQAPATKEGSEEQSDESESDEAVPMPNNYVLSGQSIGNI